MNSYNDYEKTISDVKELLNQNRKNWENRYLKAVEKYEKEKKSPLIEPDPPVEAPLFEYTSISNNKSVSILRYKGQRIGVLHLNKRKQTLSIKDYKENNKKYFNLQTDEEEGNWKDSKLANELRTLFQNNPIKNNNPEATVESSLISLLDSNNKKNTEKRIRPVYWRKKRFQMPTPLSASNKIITFAESLRQGGIDILARSGKGRGTYLTVIEIKDSDKDDTPREAMRQALAYGVFIHELIRSKKAGGHRWFKNFGFNRTPYKKETIRCLIAMPNINLEDKKFFNKTFKIDGDCLELGFLEIDSKANRIIENSLCK